MVTNKQCTGCLACYNMCSINAIQVNQLDMSVTIDRNKCINCKLCEKVCPEKKTQKDLNLFKTRTVVAAALLDEEIKEKSSSGGVFSALAQVVLKNKGMVYGAVWDKNWRVIHIGISDINDLPRMYGSKYVHSDIGLIYREICKTLENHVPVLFSGTPCQVAGLRSFLGKSDENLYTVEMLCHGISDPFLFDAYMREYHRKDIRTFSMRSKKTGWANCSYCFDVEYTDGSNYLRYNKREPYMIVFANDICLHESCYHCRYRNIRAADVSIGDYWGIEHMQSALNDGKGVSRIYVNTEKGEEMIRSAHYLLHIETVETRPPTVTGPSKERQAMREPFIYNLEKLGFRKALYRVIIPLYWSKLRGRLTLFLWRKR